MTAYRDLHACSPDNFRISKKLVHRKDAKSAKEREVSSATQSFSLRLCGGISFFILGS
jgi:hypothetical protein